MQYDIFISHASIDKETVARPLSEALQARGLSVWLDEEQLQIGDSIRRGIDEGLSQSRFGVVILSPTYLESEWTKKELDAFFNRETLHSKTILPVCHQVSREEIDAFSPMLSDKVTLSTNISFDILADKILQVAHDHNADLLKNSKDPEAQLDSNINNKVAYVHKPEINKQKLLSKSRVYKLISVAAILLVITILYSFSAGKKSNNENDSEKNLKISTGVDQVFRRNGDKLLWSKLYNNSYGSGGSGKSYALVIGISKYQEFPNLSSARNDPIRIKDYLLNEAGFDYVHLITDGRASLDRVRGVMVDYMPKLLNPNDRFFFYWSGHGTSETTNGRRTGYLPLSNSQANVFSSMLGMNSLVEWDIKLEARHTFYVLDACFTGFTGLRKWSDFGSQSSDELSSSSRQVLTAGLSDEITFASPMYGGSVFTMALLDGLRGEADAQFGRFEKDGIITASELEFYVKRRVDSERKIANISTPITPVLRRLSDGVGDFFFFNEEKHKKTLDRINSIK